MYYPTGSLPAKTWCSDRNPQGKCRPLKDICKPMDVPTLDLIKTFQRNLNRLLAQAKQRLIDVDGRIGPETVAATNSILGTSFGHCDQLTATVDAMVIVTNERIAKQKAPPVPDPKTSKPSIPGKDGDVLHPEEAGIGAIVKSPLGLAALAVGGLLAWKATQPPKKKR